MPSAMGKACVRLCRHLDLWRKSPHISVTDFRLGAGASAALCRSLFWTWPRALINPPPSCHRPHNGAAVEARCDSKAAQTIGREGTPRFLRETIRPPAQQAPFLELEQHSISGSRYR